MHLDNEELQIVSLQLTEDLGGVCKVAEAFGINSGHITHANNGKNSMALRRAVKFTKHPPRRRFTCDADDGLIAKFDAMRGTRSRREYLEHLMLLDMGIGEVV
jgi:hypothetical protein